MPKPRVWRKIAGELHPVPVGRIAAWSAGAAAAVALLVWMGWLAQAPAPQDQVGKALARLDWDATTTDRGSHVVLQPAEDGNATTTVDGNNGAAPKKGGHLFPWIAHIERHGLVPSSEHKAQQEQPTWAMVTPQNPKGLATDLAAIDAKTTFLNLLQLEQEDEYRRQIDAALQALRDAAQAPAAQGLFAQAGANVSPGSIAMNTRSLQSDQLISFPGLSLNNQAETNSRVVTENFRTPLVLGAYVDRPIIGKLGLGGGLVYTHMQSYQDVTSDFATQHIEITRQYLGLAANLSYTQPLSKRNDRLAAFATAGSQFDLGLQKRVVLNTQPTGDVTQTQTDRRDLGNQANVNAGLGMRYTVLKRLSLYAQGTAAHYFYQSDPNLYGQKLIWPSAQVGVRVAL